MRAHTALDLDPTEAIMFLEARRSIDSNAVTIYEHVWDSETGEKLVRNPVVSFPIGDGEDIDQVLARHGYKANTPWLGHSIISSIVTIEDQRKDEYAAKLHTALEEFKNWNGTVEGMEL